jgi:sulfur-oxidizing protein SoxB
MLSRRQFIELAAATAAVTGFSGGLTRLAAQQKLSEKDLLKFDAKGQVTLLHLTDIHAQLKPLYFRPPSENFGVGAFEGIPPHLVGDEFLKHFKIERGSALAYAHTMVDYVDLAKAYGRLGGLDRIATLVKAIRAERGDDKVLLLDGGDTWQGSYTALKTNGQDMVDCMKLLKPDAMVGHWEFTLGEARVKEMIAGLGYPFLGGNVLDNEFEEPVFESTAMFDKGGVKVAVIGQAFPYTPIANPRWMIPKWSFGIRPERVQKHVDDARAKGAQLVVLLSHNGCDVDQKLARVVKGIDVILTGHTHDAVPVALKIEKTLILSSGSHGKYLGRIDLEVKNGQVVDYNSHLIPVFSDAITPDKEMAAKIAEVRKPYEAECTRVIGKTESLLYRRGNFNGSWDDLICQALIEERDAEISLSPGFRWGTTLMPGQDITMDDLYTQTAMTYPNVYRLEFTGAQIKEIMEDVCDNLFHKDPFYQQGGDMVRVGGISYSCAPKADKGARINDITITKTGKALEADKKYVMAGWASVNQGTQGPPVYELVEKYIAKKKVINLPKNETVKVVGM